MTWNMMYVSMNELSHEGRLLVQFEGLVHSEEKVMDVLLFPKLRYFLTSTSEGLIYVFKYTNSGKLETTRRLVHCFKGHHKQVTSICQFQKSSHLILSVSLDSTARIWCINTFQHHYTFQLSSGL